MAKSYPFKKIEKKWQKKWELSGLYAPDLARAKNPFYNLMMFPYPSGEGLHIGNMYAFVGSDIFGRFMRMRGKNVFEPIGLDGFGIHSENYALKIRKHPAKLAKITEKNFYRQLSEIGNGFSWKSKVETYDPEYYRWTQWIFVQMFKKGLAVRKKAEVNWCPKCKTVLADEQVVSGECERCGALVAKKELEQWFFKITDYAERLLNDLEKIDWSEKVKIAQRNWIGKSEGSKIKFQIAHSKQFVEVFTTRPDTIFGATFLVVNPKHPMITNSGSGIKNLGEVRKYLEGVNKKRQELINKLGVELNGIKATNPATNEEVPIWVSDYVLASYGGGAIMGVPAHDQRDFEFAKKYNLPIKIVVCSNYPEKTCPILDTAYEGEGYLVASGDFDGMSSEKAREETTKWLAEKSLAKKETHYHLRDWLISRQRYWGPPIPLVFCENCKKSAANHKSNKGEMLNPGWIAVPEKDLPIKLPYIKNFRPLGMGKSPLAEVTKFYDVKCPKCGNQARRETDVSDTFLDSSWYFFRYVDSKNKKEPFGVNRIKKWLPVDMYIGGVEHSVLHLLYARFITKVFSDWGLINFDEPFKKFRAHGLIIKDGAKMSKSKGNVVIPDRYIKLFGADAMRMYLMFLGPFENGGDFRGEGIRGISRFLNRVWNLLSLKLQNTKHKQSPNHKYQNPKLEKVLHKSIKKITEDIENLHYNTAISQLMILLNKIEESDQKISIKNYELFLQLLAPFAPFISEGLWGALGNKSSIHVAGWPEYDSEKIKEDFLKIPIQVDGKTRALIEVFSDETEAKIKEKALDHPRIKNFIGSQKIQKVIAIPKKIVNIVLVR